VQLVADGSLQERRRDGGVNPSGEPQDDVAVSHLFTDVEGLFLDERGGGPIPAAAADFVGEVLQNLPAEVGVDDLRMELDPVVRRLGAADRRHPSVVSLGDDFEVVR